MERHRSLTVAALIGAVAALIGTVTALISRVVALIDGGALTDTLADALKCDHSTATRSRRWPHQPLQTGEELSDDELL